MSFFNKYPHSDFHELNLDWIISEVKRVEKIVDDFTVFNTLTWSGVWDASKSYVKWSIVQDGAGNGYISIKAVPSNVPLTNTEYWQMIAKYSDLYAAFNARISALESVVGDASSGLVKDVSDNTNDIVDLKNSKYWITVKEYGAIGDGITDDTDAFIAAFTSGADVIVIPDGEYLITDIVEIPSNTIVLGTGNAIIKDTVVALSADPTYEFKPFFLIDNASNIRIENIIFTSDNEQYQNDINYTSHFYITQSEDVKIIKCTFDNAKAGIDISVNDSINVHVNKCIFNKYKYTAVGFYSSAYCYCSDCKFTDNGLNYVNTYGIAVSYHGAYDESKRSNHIYITNNFFDYPNNTSVWESIDAHGIADAVISNNIIKNARLGIALSTEYARGFTNNNVIVSNNIVETYTQSNFEFTYGIGIGGSNISVNNNTLVGGGRTLNGSPSPYYCAGLFISDRLIYSKINNNTFISCGAHSISVITNGTNNLTIGDVEISGNMFNNVTSIGGVKEDIGFSNITKTGYVEICNNFFNSSTININTSNILSSSVLYPFLSNNTYFAAPNFDDYSKICPDVVSDPSSLSYGRNGRICRVFAPASGNPLWYVYASNTWTAH